MTATGRVGFVGLGTIGKPMALRLTDLDLWVYDVQPGPVAELVEAGATAAGSVAGLAEAAVVCVMVRDDDQVRSVAAELLGSGGSPVVAVHSTVAPSTPAELQSMGLRVLDAPVSGGPMGAADGSLAIMVGGDDASYAAAATTRRTPRRSRSWPGWARRCCTRARSAPAPG